MGINQLIKTIKTPISKNDMIGVNKLTNEELKEYTVQYKIPDRDGLQQIADYFNRELCHLYINTKGMHPLVYWDGAVYVEVLAYGEEFLKEFHIKEMIDQQYENIENAMKNKIQLKTLMFMCNGNARYLVFEHIYNQIPDNQKYEYFKMLYTSSEYGFKMFTDNFIESVLEHKPVNDLKKLIQRIGPITREGDVTIYRGMCSESTAAEHAWSWTTNLPTAIFFATRFKVGGKIATAKVCLNDIIDFIDDRNEFEVFVNPKDVKEIEEETMMDFKDMQKELEDNGIIDIYHAYCTFIDADSYFEPKGLHGVLHAKRVLLLSLILASYELGGDENIMGWASVIHDIGRDHNGEDEYHGEQSWIKASENDMLPDELDSEDLEILRYVVEQHCKPDEEIFNNIRQYKITNEIRAWNALKVFKDSDALDRVRLNDLDPKYLRTRTSKLMILLAHQFLKGIR